VFSDYDYLHEVWTHHAEIVNAIADGDIDKAYQWLVRHTELLQQHPKARAARNAISKSTVRQPAIA
jgi:DNA-binding GntR family transcriptional regulator